VRVLESSLFVFVLAFAFSVSADPEADFQALKNITISYETKGTICEQVAKLRFVERFPSPDYDVITGIAYRTDSETLGELDIVVFDRASGDVVEIAEVKCWKELDDGYAKALEQRARFLKAIRSNKPLTFQSTGDQSFFKQSQFAKVTSFKSIAQKGAVSVGYDLELEYTLPELMQLRSRILMCRTVGECPK
jgi:hypothetical protein